jgi:hypothetical protein
MNLNILLNFVKSKTFFALLSIVFFHQSYGEIWQIDNVKSDALNKQEERIERLKKRLTNLEKAKNDALQKYLVLKEKLFKEELSLIEKKVKRFKRTEKKIKKDECEWQEFLKKDLNDLFLPERKVLTEMLNDCPSISSKEKTQLLLDNILNTITFLNEQKTENNIR